MKLFIGKAKKEAFSHGFQQLHQRIKTAVYKKKLLKCIVIIACKREQNKEEGRNEVFSSHFWGKK